ncbi:MAG TPA: class I SAM-dependent methyltransferase [Candidatus Dojkabacteria bacterium]|nr:class I SAM-dependent methyltransferase [Candidatus Dojkabacteria bacterium]HQF36398.1 class I SAM-dependent methyltransferase [Candidatus Dojkabacteria bacterium]
MKRQQNINTNKLWNKYAINYDVLNVLVAYNELIELFIKKIKKYGDGKNLRTIIDLGCGTGSLTVLLASNFPNAVIFAIDNSDEMLKILDKKVKKQQITNIRILKHNILDVDTTMFPEADIIVMNNVLYTINDKRKLLLDMQRGLKKNGIIVFSDPVPVGKYNYWSIIRRQFGLLSLIFKSILLCSRLLWVLSWNKKIDRTYIRLDMKEYKKLLCDLGHNILEWVPPYAGQANLFVIKLYK